MNPKIRSLLVFIGLLTLIIVGIIVIPRGLSLYYQTKGGQHVEYVLRFEEGIQELVCEPLLPTDEEGRDKVEKGIEGLNRSIILNKNNSQAYYFLGKAYCLLGEPEEAKENYLQYTELRPENPLGSIGLGFTYEKLGEMPSAKEAWISSSLSIEEILDAGKRAGAACRHQ